jgi:hypothetical protein
MALDTIPRTLEPHTQAFECGTTLRERKSL